MTVEEKLLVEGLFKELPIIKTICESNKISDFKTIQLIAMSYNYGFEDGETKAIDEVEEKISNWLRS